MDASELLAWAEVILSGAVTVILIPLAVYFVRYYWDRRRWRAFERLVRTWAETFVLHDELSDDEWNALVVMMLSDAGFEPERVKDLQELAVWHAKALVSLVAWDAEKLASIQRTPR